MSKYKKKNWVEWVLDIDSEEKSEKLISNILKWFPWVKKIVDVLSRHIDRHPRLYRWLGEQ